MNDKINLNKLVENKEKGYGKVVNFWVPEFEDFNPTKPNLYRPKTGKRSLVTLYKEGDFEIKIYVANNWIRELNKSETNKIFSIGINENFNYSTPDLNPNPKTEDISEKYISISGKILIDLFEKKGIAKSQKELYGGFIPEKQTVLQSLKTMLNLTDDQIKPYINTESTNTKTPALKQEEKHIDLNAEQKAAEKLAEIDGSDELSF